MNATMDEWTYKTRIRLGMKSFQRESHSTYCGKDGKFLPLVVFHAWKIPGKARIRWRIVQ